MRRRLIESTRSSASSGRIVQFLDPWMTPRMREGLAEFVARRADITLLVGANMAVSRSVLDRVPGFDIELGCEGRRISEDGYTAEDITADSIWGHRWAWQKQ